MQINTQLAKAFNRAVTTAENLNSDGSVNWNFVDADMFEKWQVMLDGDTYTTWFDKAADIVEGVE